jgi:hypothetical protein
VEKYIKGKKREKEKEKEKSQKREEKYRKVSYQEFLSRISTVSKNKI